jgi:starch synthase
MPHVLHVATECAPLAKVGGLSDVVGALPRYQRRLDPRLELSVLMPWYGHLAIEPGDVVATGICRWGSTRLFYAVRRAAGAPLDVPLYVVDHGLFAAPGVYADARTGQAFEPELLRHGLLTHAAMSLACTSRAGQARGVAPVDLLHAHDYHAGLVALWLRHSPPAWALPRIPVLLTVHNARYQGRTPHPMLENLDITGLPHGDGDHAGRFNCLKAAMFRADLVTTVSPTHARELQELPDASDGLDYAFRMISGKLTGILNGIDTEAWDPARDPLIAAAYDALHPAGKAACKADLCRHEALDPLRPVLGYIGRLVPEKGMPLLCDAFHELVRREPDVQLVVVASGDPSLRDRLARLAGELPRHLRLALRYDEGLAHRLYAGADVMLVPSWVEPCGLTQMYALRYGTVPVVHPVGGLRDTVVPFDAATRRGNGAWIEPFTVDGLCGAVQRALGWWRDEANWRILRFNAMTTDLSWERSARAYRDTYARLTG